MSTLISQLLSALTWPLRMLVELTMGFVPGSKRMLSLSLPARVALLVAVFLVVCVATAFVAFYQTENRASWNYWVNPVRVTVIAVLLVVIPVVVYQVLRLWLTGVRSRFPDIDEAWRAGLAELQRCGIDLAETPIFLILGSADEALEKAVRERVPSGNMSRDPPPARTSAALPNASRSKTSRRVGIAL